MFSATSSSAGTFTGYLNNAQIGQKTGVGYLYAHAQDVGIGWMKDESRFHGENLYNNGYTFTGIIAKVAHYNAALSGATLQQLHDYMGYEYNTAPHAVDDNVMGVVNTLLVGSVLTNNGNGLDSDPESDLLKVSAGTITSEHGATVVLSSNGGFTYTPVVNFSGDDSFSYTLLDTKGGFDTGTVNVAVSPTPAPAANQVFLLNPVSVNTLISSSAINLNTYFSAKTISVAFETGIDVFSRQVIYEQGGGVRGLAIFIENGKLYQAVWNYYAGVDWGYKETEIQINQNSQYTTTFVFSATGSSTGALTSYLNGVEFGGQTGTGYLYAHGDEVGIGWMKDESRFHGSNVYADGYVFTGTIGKVVQYNAALSGADLHQLEDYMSFNWLNSENSGVFGTAGNNSLVGTDNSEAIWGLQGNDILYSKGGLDVLIGGTGADTFVFEAGSAFSGVDVIRDFSKIEGDKIDLNDILSEYDPLTEAITDFVQITTSGADSIVKVDIDGAGTAHGFIQIATIAGVTGLTDEQALVTSGNLVV